MLSYNRTALKVCYLQPNEMKYLRELYRYFYGSRFGGWMSWMSWMRMSWLVEEDGVVASAASPAPGPVWVELPADSVFNPKTSSHGFPARVNHFNF